MLWSVAVRSLNGKVSASKSRESAQRYMYLKYRKDKADWNNGATFNSFTIYTNTIYLCNPFNVQYYTRAYIMDCFQNYTYFY